MNDVIVKKVAAEDAKAVLELTRELSKYESLEFSNNEQLLGEALKKGYLEAIICYLDDLPCGLATYFFNYSTFGGYRGLFIEDLFVNPDIRGFGIGKALMSELAKTALDMNCKKISWVCLDWNKLGMGFYEAMGAKNMPEWIQFTLSEDKMKELISGAQR
jgi:Predicted acetyltransferase